MACSLWHLRQKSFWQSWQKYSVFCTHVSWEQNFTLTEELVFLESMSSDAQIAQPGTKIHHHYYWATNGLLLAYTIFFRGAGSVVLSCVMLRSSTSIKVSSNPKNWGIHRWRFFIYASYVHPQISLNVVSFYNLCNIFFADKCLKIKLLIDICTVFCRIKKTHRLAYSH